MLIDTEECDTDELKRCIEEIQKEIDEREKKSMEFVIGPIEDFEEDEFGRLLE